MCILWFSFLTRIQSRILPRCETCCNVHIPMHSSLNIIFWFVQFTLTLPLQSFCFTLSPPCLSLTLSLSLTLCHSLTQSVGGFLLEKHASKQTEIMCADGTPHSTLCKNKWRGWRKDSYVQFFFPISHRRRMVLLWLYFLCSC